MSRASTEPLVEVEVVPSVIVELDQIDDEPPHEPPRRFRTAVGTTPPELRPPETFDAVPREIRED